MMSQHAQVNSKFDTYDGLHVFTDMLNAPLGFFSAHALAVQNLQTTTSHDDAEEEHCPDTFVGLLRFLELPSKVGKQLHWCCTSLAGQYRNPTDKSTKSAPVGYCHYSLHAMLLSAGSDCTALNNVVYKPNIKP